MARTILLVLLLSLVASNILAKRIGGFDNKPDNKDKDKNKDDKDRQTFFNGGQSNTYVYAPPKEGDENKNETAIEPPKEEQNSSFSGEGHSFGGPTAINNEDSTSNDSAAEIAKQNEENEKIANEKLNVDESQPTTMVQIRLADGNRLSVCVNLSHTINDLRNFILNARPQYATQSFVLMNTFPKKELTDLEQTVEKAGIANAAIMQRLK